MSTAVSFVSHKKFYGEEHFPYGIARSGEFTRKQASLLEDHGTAYYELHHGLRTPSTVEEKAFLKVCTGEKAAQTPHELAWQRYCEKTKPRRPPTSSMIHARTEDLSGDHEASDSEW